jgi:6-phosphogluconolactonase (cycloisomerase 2 family)
MFLGLTPSDKIPWGFAFSPDAQFLLVTAFEGATLTAFKVTADGNLSPAGSLAWGKKISSITTR